MSGQQTMGKSSGIIAYICTYLPKITAKIDQQDQAALNDLDLVISHYIQKRQEQRQPILNFLDQDTLDTTQLNFKNLLVLHNHSSNSLLELSKEQSHFNKTKEELRQCNLEATQDLLSGDDGFNQMGQILNLCRGLIIKLTQYIYVGKYVTDLNQYRDKRNGLGRNKTFIQQVTQYITEMDQILKPTPNDNCVNAQNSILKMVNKPVLKDSEKQPSTKDTSQNISLQWVRKTRLEKPYFNFQDQGPPKFSLLFNVIE